MMQEKRIGLIGFGNMGAAIAAALKGKYSLGIYDKYKKVKFASAKIYHNPLKLIKNFPVLIIAIKPQDIENFINDNYSAIKQSRPLIISIAAGVKTSFYEKKIAKIKVIRVMPNLCVLAGKSFSALVKGKHAAKSSLILAKRIFSYLGKTLIVKNESDIDKITALSGSGPGYLAYIMEAMQKSAQKMGFSRRESYELVLFTVEGAVELLKKYKLGFEELLKRVKSPKGTTEAAIATFDKYKLNKIIGEGIDAAYKRAGKLGRR